MIEEKCHAETSVAFLFAVKETKAYRIMDNYKQSDC